MNQQIYNVLPSRPHGRRSLGNVTVNSDPHTRRLGTATSGTPNLSLNSGAYSDGQLLVIAQLREMESLTADNHEVVQVQSGGGTTSLVLTKNLGRNYSNAQVVDLLEYDVMTFGTWAIMAWNGNIGALFCFAARVAQGAGTINGNGANGFPSTSDVSGVGSLSGWRSAQAGGGFQGGWNSADGNTSASGEGIGSGWGRASGSITEIKNTGDNGGGGVGGGGGAGGGNATNGEDASFDSNGKGGREVGNTALTSMFPGGGGGGGNAPGQDGPASGGNGGAMCIAWVDRWLVTGGLQVNGGNGGDTTNPPFGGGGNADGGGGAGGSIKLNIGTLGQLGSNLITATKGVSQTSGGDGSVGRIRVNYGGKITGSTNPTASTARDPRMLPPQGFIGLAM